MNAFELISSSNEFSLENLFEKQAVWTLFLLTICFDDCLTSCTGLSK